MIDRALFAAELKARIAANHQLRVAIDMQRADLIDMLVDRRDAHPVVEESKTLAARAIRHAARKDKS